MVNVDDDDVDPFTDSPAAVISPSEFETFVVELLNAVAPDVSGLDIRLHDKVKTNDGTYDFDVTVRFELLGMRYLTLVEAKRHKNPIKRDLVQILHQKLQSVGGQKAMMISTASYQRGAIEFAVSHGISLVKVTEGRFTYIAHSKNDLAPMSREEAWEAFQIPTFAGWHFAPYADSMMKSVVSVDLPDRVLEMLVSPEQTG